MSILNELLKDILKQWSNRNLASHNKKTTVLSFEKHLCATLYRRWQQEVGQSFASFHSLPNLLPIRPASAQHSTQRPGTRTETAAGSSYGRSRHRCSSPYSGCNHPPPDWTTLPTGRSTYLPHHPPSTAHTDWLSHAGSQDGKCCAHCWCWFRCSNRWVLMVNSVRSRKTWVAR